MSKPKRPRRLADNEAMAMVRALRTSPQKLNLVCQTIRGKSAEAARQLEQLVAHDPDDADSWYQLGVARERGGDRDAAETAWRRVVELAPGHELARHALGIPR